MKELHAKKLADAIIAVTAKAYARPLDHSVSPTRDFDAEDRQARLDEAIPAVREALRMYLVDRLSGVKQVQALIAAKTLDKFYMDECSGRVVDGDIFQRGLGRRRE